MNEDITATIRKSMVRTRGEPRSRETQLSQIPHLPYIKGVTNRVTKVLIKKDIIATFKPLETIR
jgi:hypothetical protein